MYRTIEISKESIESIVTKSDAVLIYLKSGKCWVCEQIISNKDNTLKFTLKGKSDK